MDGYEYECFEMSLIPIMVGKVLSDVGREEDYLEGIEIGRASCRERVS